MSKFKTSLIIIGIIVLIVVAALATFIALSFAGVIVTEPQELVFVVNDNVKDYDGKPLVADGYEIQSGNLFEGHEAVVEFTGSQTEVGEGVSGMSVKVVDENGFDVTDEYAIKVNGGKLTVAQAEVTVSLEAQDAIYSGEKVIFDGYTVTVGKLAEGHRAGAAKAGAGMISVGETLSSADLIPAIYDNNGQNVTYNYKLSFSMNVDKVEVVPRPITVQPVGAEKIYDGASLSCSNYEIVSGSIVDRQYAVVTYVPADENLVDCSISSVGELEVKPEVKIYSGYNENRIDVTENYEIEYLTAVLKITPRPLVIVAKSAQREFNGSELNCYLDNAPYDAIGLVNGESVTVSYSGSVLNVGEDVNSIDSYEIMSGEAVTTDNYEVSLVDGTLAVTPAKITLNLPDISKEYDGQPYGGTINGSFAMGENVMVYEVNAYESLGNIVEAGQAAYSATGYNIYADGVPCTDNFIVTFIPGILRIVPKQVTLYAEETAKIYDGKPFTFNAENLSVYDAAYGSGLVGEHRILTVTTNPVINATLSAVCTLSVKIVDERGADVSKNYNIDGTTVSVTINKRVTKIGTDSAEKIYDGEPLFADGGYGSDLVSGDYVAIKDGAQIISITEAGNLENNFEYEIYNALGEVVTDNYEVAPDGVEYGILTVNKKVITIGVNDAQGEYTGEGVSADFDELVTCEPYEYADFSFNSEDFKFNTETFVEAGEYELSIIINNYQEQFDNYDFVLGTGTFTVTKKKVSIDIGDKSDTFSGSAVSLQKVAGFYNDVDLGIDGYNLEVVKSSIVGVSDAGKYAVVSEFKVYKLLQDGIREYYSENFELTAKNSYYTIKPLEMDMDYTGSLTKVYDGTAFEVDCSKLSFSPINGAYYYVEADSVNYNKIVKVVTNENNEVLKQKLTISSPHLIDSSGKEVSSNNVKVRSLPQDVTILKREITVAIGSVVVDSGIKESDVEDLLDTLGNAELNKALMPGDHCQNISGADIDGTDIYYNLTGLIYNAANEDVTNCYNLECFYFPIGKIVYI